MLLSAAKGQRTGSDHEISGRRHDGWQAWRSAGRRGSSSKKDGKDGFAIKKILRDIVVFCLVAVLAMLPLVAVRAVAGAHPLAAGTNDATETSAEDTGQTSSSIHPASDAGSLSSYFLTNAGFVTPVKLQNPWGACWAFAIASAVESSILKAQATLDGTIAGSDGTGAPKMTQLNGAIDISERAIAWLAHELQTEQTAGAQAGEGYTRVNTSDPATQLAGGNFTLVEAMLTSRQALVPESAAPYQYNGYSAGSLPWYSLDAATGGDARTMDWSIDDSLRITEEISWRVSDIVKLESPAVMNYNELTGIGHYVGYDADATRAIKQALVDIGAVAIALEADASQPDSIINQQSYANATGSTAHFNFDTWSQYNASATTATNHAVTIVGWDDAYSAQNFAGTESSVPPGNGAWLCKNNWGSDEFFAQLGNPQDAPHWGIRDASGAATGFFWISYYDHTITSPVAFEVHPISEDFETLYQYDYLGASEFSEPSSYDAEIRTANVFEAQSTELVRAVTAQTFKPDETVRVWIYTLPPQRQTSGNADSNGASTETNGDASDSTSLDASSNSSGSASAVNTEANASGGSIEGAGEASVPSGESEASDVVIDESAKSVIVNTDMIIRPDSINGEEILSESTYELLSDYFNDEHKVFEDTFTFDEAGFHTIELSSPVLVVSGERFAVVQQVTAASDAGDSAESETNYLNLELAFLDDPSYIQQETSATVVANPGETFVMMFDEQWMSLEAFNAWYADYRASVGQATDISYGNALIKALSDGTSMNDESRIYKLVRL